MTIIKFPARYDVRISYQRRARKPACPIIRMPAKPVKQTAQELYLQGCNIDDNDPKAGLALYMQAIALDPGLAIAYTNAGNCHFRLHQIDRAEELYKQALTLDPNQCEALYNLAYLALERGQALESLPLFQQAIDADPSFADAWFNYAMALEQLNRPATLQWQRYLSLEPTGKWADIARRHVG